MQDWKMADKSAADKNVEHVVLTFKNYQTNVNILGVSVSFSQLSIRLSRPTLRKRSPVGGDNRISLRNAMEDKTLYTDETQHDFKMP